MLKKKICCCLNKQTEEIPGPCNAKEHYQSFVRKKNKK